MLGKFTFLFDFAHRIPVFGSSRIPVRYHLWFSFAIAALAGVGVDRLCRVGLVQLRGAGLLSIWLVLLSIPLLLYSYSPIWSGKERWTLQYHQNRYHWLAVEIGVAAARTALLAGAAWLIAKSTSRATNPITRSRLAACLPVLILADLLGSHSADVASITPDYWTKPPASVAVLKRDPTFERLFADAKLSAGEPGYASEPIDFLPVRDTLNWSLPPVWGLKTSRGETPIIPARLLNYTDTVKPGRGRYDLEGVTHFLTAFRPQSTSTRYTQAGVAYIVKNPNALPRVRLVGRPVYAKDKADALKSLQNLGAEVRDRLVVEDPKKPLPEEADVSGTARIVREIPEQIEVETESNGPAYLVLSDTFDPGWSARIDGKPVEIHPAYVAFRAVYVPSGKHTLVFRYSPAGFKLGLILCIGAAMVAMGLVLFGPRLIALSPDHSPSRWSSHWPAWGAGVLVAIVVLSLVQVDGKGHVSVQRRWKNSFHGFTWGAGIAAMREMAPAAQPPSDPSP